MSEQNVVRISRRAVPWFEGAFSTRALGQSVIWDIVFGPGKMPDGQLGPAFTLYAEVPAHQIGRRHALFATLPALGLTEETVDAAVGELLAKLHELRARELSGAVNGATGLVTGRG